MYLNILSLVLILCIKSAILEDNSDEYPKLPYRFHRVKFHKSEESLTSTDLKELKTQIDNIEETLNTFKDEWKNSQKNLEALNQQMLELKNSLQFSKQEVPKHCKDIQDGGENASGIYNIRPEFALEPFLVFCDMETQGGGWTYFLNRFKGNQDFYLDWEEYENGFGNLAGEFWLGLDKLHYLTGYEVNELLIELEDWNSEEVYAFYNSFSIGNGNEGYSLKLLGEYSGTAGDSLRYHSGMKFTTKDKDQDRYKGGNCGNYRGGGWWYKNCADSHLTGKYLKAEVATKEEFNIMYWQDFRGSKYSLKEARMMVRPKGNEDNSN